MSASHGATSTPLESIASYKLYLYPSDSEVAWDTHHPSPWALRDQMLQSLYAPNTRPNQDQNRLPGEPLKPLVSSSPPYPYASGVVGGFQAKPSGTMLRWLESQGSRFSSFLTWIRFYRLQNYLNSQDQSGSNDYTLFAPEDCTSLWKLARSGEITPEELLRFHMLDWTLLPIQIFNRKLRVQTMLNNRWFLIDHLSVRDGEAASNPDVKVETNRILQTQKTDNGFVYSIDRSLKPSTYY